MERKDKILIKNLLVVAPASMVLLESPDLVYGQMKCVSGTEFHHLCWRLGCKSRMVSVSSRPHFKIATFQLNVTERKLLVF